ncbi:MAG: TraR/DksA family transcriptional regulator, partial [Gammaproteobacteria bacterium]
MNTPDQSKIATQALLRRAAELRIDISRELEKRDEEHFSDLAGAITDRGEEAVADLLVDINLAEISRDVEELREVEAALKRLSVGTY